jgi:DNA primase
MRFSPSFLDELKARLQVSEVVGRRVKLKKSGREWKGLSPFQQEKTPSFFVNDQKQAWFDFSSGKNGNIFDFLVQTEGLSFPEAVERLASMAGMALPQSSPEADRREEKQRTLFDVMELATKYFEQNLASNAGAQARGYLADRSIFPATQVEFRLGYAKGERFALKEFLGSKGISNADMIEAGLLVAGDDIPVPYDRFRDRVIIPIHDQRGRVIAFGGRTLKSDVQPKYLNSPETSIFHKGSVVFNFHRARQPAHESGSVIAVEGYMDAIAIYQAGLKGVVATMGTAFTEEQVATLWRLSSEPVICFDSDRAGIVAAQRSIDRILPLLKVGRTFRFVFMEEDKDPDDLIREKGVETFREVLAGSLPMWDVLWERETANADVRTPDHQAALEQKLYAIIRTIKEPSVYTAYFRTCRMQLANLFWQVGRSSSTGTWGSNKQHGKLERKHVEISREGKRHGLQKVLLGMLVHYPDFLEEKQDQVTRLQFAPRLNEFCDALYRLLIVEQELSVRNIYASLKPTFYELLQDIHGEESGIRPWGYKLFLRFPILKRDPPRDFISRCIDHFGRIIHLHEIDDDIERVKLEAGSSDDDVEMDQLVNLVRERQKEDSEIEAEAAVLAEEADAITRVWAPERGSFQVAA